MERQLKAVKRGLRGVTVMLFLLVAVQAGLLGLKIGDALVAARTPVKANPVRAVSPQRILAMNSESLLGADGLAPACVMIRTNRGMGTGALLPDGRIVTAFHVVVGSSWIEAHGMVVTLESADPNRDVCVLAPTSPFEERGRWGWGKAQAGLAYIYVYEEKTHSIREIPVRIRAAKDVAGQHVFVGWTPFHGSSGSPVVQSGKVVAVITRHHFGLIGAAGPVAIVLED